MRTILAASLVTGAMALTATMGYAAPPAQSTTKPSASAKRSHATIGTVKSIDSTTLVITRPGAKGGDMTFSISPSTHREGAVDVGSKVSVRYQQEGQTHMATAVSAARAEPVTRMRISLTSSRPQWSRFASKARRRWSRASRGRFGSAASVRA